MVIWMNWCGKLWSCLHHTGQMKDTDPGPHPGTTDYSKTSQELVNANLGLIRSAGVLCWGTRRGFGPVSWIRSGSRSPGKSGKGTETFRKSRQTDCGGICDTCCDTGAHTEIPNGFLHSSMYPEWMVITLWALKRFIILLNQCGIRWEQTPGRAKIKYSTG